jgi:xylose isomerase
VAYSVAHGIFGSIDANRGDYQNGWDTDQFPNSVDELSLVLYEILQGGGFTTGGFNFDTKLRRQSMDRTDLFHGHIGGIDALARSLLVAAALVETETLSKPRAERYARWSGDLGSRIRSRSESLDSLEAQVMSGELNPHPVSGRQELLEERVNRVIWTSGT